jgi:stringent starvation protein B
MSEQSAKPYLIRAICEWCADNGLTPYLAVKVNAETRVPMSYVKNGEIVLNIGASATRRLTIDNGGVRFSARFSGTSQEVAVPMTAVAGIFAKETGYGFAFTVVQNPVASLAEATSSPEPEIDAALQSDLKEAKEPKEARGRSKSKTRASHLQIIK